jgi:hypothetical protein
MDMLMNDVSKYYRMGNLYNNGKIDTSLLSSRYISTLNKIKTANFNKKYFDEAKAKVT